jgi:hypothetical protein
MHRMADEDYDPAPDVVQRSVCRGQGGGRKQQGRPRMVRCRMIHATGLFSIMRTKEQAEQVVADVPVIAERQRFGRPKAHVPRVQSRP